MNTLKIIPFMWIIVMLSIRLIAGPIVRKLTPKFAGPTDGFNARVLLNTLLNVTVLSLWLSFEHFFHIWPRNFGVAFWIEILIAQPIARFAMKKLHLSQARKALTVNS
ncbi:hypothetical protein [Paenibacillus sp. sgz500958]|uniref:hypothetical protein n=1 Tax=Paenibacillus sp. sgz500958 TaxID=3242475 RepID=UPI0036D3364E